MRWPLLPSVHCILFIYFDCKNTSIVAITVEYGSKRRNCLPGSVQNWTIQSNSRQTPLTIVTQSISLFLPSIVYLLSYIRYRLSSPFPHLHKFIKKQQATSTCFNLSKLNCVKWTWMSLHLYFKMPSQCDRHSISFTSTHNSGLGVNKTLVSQQTSSGFLDVDSEWWLDECYL